MSTERSETFYTNGQAYIFEADQTNGCVDEVRVYDPSMENMLVVITFDHNVEQATVHDKDFDESAPYWDLQGYSAIEMAEWAVAIFEDLG